jgi:Molecular chaperone
LGPYRIKEIFRTSGDYLGGLLAEKAFEEYLKEAFGEDKVLIIKQNHPHHWMQLMEEFEQAKIDAKNKEATEDIFLKSSKECLWGRKRFSVKKKLGIIKSDFNIKPDGRIFFPNSALSNIIMSVSTLIEHHIVDLFKSNDEHRIDAVLLIGGFAKSPFIRDKVETLVGSKIPVIQPENSELCVVMGAVMSGWKSNIITSRRSRYTYGFGVHQRFVKGNHDESKSYRDENGIKWCRRCFKKLVTINDELPIDKCVEDVAVYPHKDFTTTITRLYCTEESDAKYTDDERVELIGIIKIPSSKEKKGKRLIKKVYFGDTEIKVNIIDKESGEVYEERFNFLINS